MNELSTADLGSLDSQAESSETEVIVVGGGPAGSSVAALLAAAGHEVVLLDKARFPRHKACSEYINPGGVRVLDQFGMGDAIRAAGAHQMQQMTVHAPGGDQFAANFAGVKQGEMALGLSRYRLDAMLLDEARAKGTTVIERCHVRDLMRDGERVSGVEAIVDGHRRQIRARVVIGADGRHSVVARMLGVSRAIPFMKRTGLVAHYRSIAGFGDFGEMHIGHDGYAGIAPLEDGLFNVAFVTSSESVSLKTSSLEDYFVSGLHAIPGLADRLAGATRVGSVRGVGPMAHRVRRTAGDGFLLVGDAAGFLDPFTGDGIYEALRGAQIAAPIVHKALVSGELSAAALRPYREARLREFTAKRSVSLIVQGFVRSPTLMDYVTDRLGGRESLARTLTGVLGNFRPAQDALSPLFLGRLLRP